MQKKLTLTIDEAVYYKLHSVIGERKISKFIERLVKPYVINEYLEAAYQDMAHDIAAEQEAYNWVRVREYRQMSKNLLVSSDREDAVHTK